MRLTSLGDCGGAFRESLGKLPVTQDSPPEDDSPRITRLGIGENYFGKDEDVPRADVAVKNTALDNGRFMGWIVMTSIR